MNLGWWNDNRKSLTDLLNINFVTMSGLVSYNIWNERKNIERVVSYIKRQQVFYIKCKFLVRDALLLFFSNIKFSLV